METLNRPKQQRVVLPSLDLSSLCSPVPAAHCSTKDFHAQPTAPALASAESAVQIPQQDDTCMNLHADCDSDGSNDSFDLFAPFKPPPAAAAVEGEAAAASKADSDEGATATVQDWTESNSHDTDENDFGNGSDGPPDSPAHQRAIPSM